MNATENLIYSPEAWNIQLAKLEPDNIVVLTDHNTGKHCFPLFSSEYLLNRPYIHLQIAPGEGSKSLEQAEKLYSEMMEYSVGKKSLMVCLGGGVITDLGGFIASTYKRGMQLAHVPTTYLAMVDAALGGKNGVNFEGKKNQIGTFYLPQLTLIDHRFLDSLDHTERMSGFAETIKHALIADTALWHLINESAPSEAALNLDILSKSAAIKLDIVRRDPLESGIRQALNFGHTIGHAIEAECNLPHGQAIAFGMLAEAWISTQLEGLPASQLVEILVYIQQLQFPYNGLKYSVNSLINRMQHDKKNRLNNISFSLISKIGTPVTGIPVRSNMIEEAVAFAYKNLGG